MNTVLAGRVCVSRLDQCQGRVISNRCLPRLSGLQGSQFGQTASFRSIRPNHRVEKRQLSVSASKVAVTEPWWTKGATDNLKDIHSVQDLVDELAGAHDRLVIVDFYAKWCNACRALYPKLVQMAKDNPDILFLKVDWDENKPVAKALSVKVLPYFHFYRGAEGRVATFSASVSKIQRLRDAIAEHNAPRCSLGKDTVTLSELDGLSSAEKAAAVSAPVMAVSNGVDASRAESNVVVGSPIMRRREAEQEAATV